MVFSQSLLVETAIDEVTHLHWRELLVEGRMTYMPPTLLA